MKSRLHFEVWTWNNWGLNRFLGIKSLQLLDVVTGSVNRDLHLVREKKKKDEAVCNLSLKIKFEEIWDFKVTMLDWQFDDIKDRRKPNDTISSWVRVTLTDGRRNLCEAETDTVKNDFSPNFNKFDKALSFRGTFNELLSQKLVIEVYSKSVLSKLIGTKIINLRTSLLTNVVKTNVLIHDKQLAGLKGIIRAPRMPRYGQRDFADEIVPEEFYLVIHLQKIDVFSSLEDRGDFGVYATVEWGGIVIKSKTVKSALINEIMHFNIPMEPDVKKDRNKMIDFLNDDLQTKSDIRFNIWIDFGDQLVDNLGTAYASLAYLYNSESDEKIFKDTKQNKKIRFVTRIYNGKVNLKSAFNDTTSCNIFYGMWFQPEIPNPEIDLSKLKGSFDVDRDLPYEVKDKLLNHELKNDLDDKIDTNFITQSLKEDRLFKTAMFKDQYEVQHYPMRFLSQMTSPDILNLEYIDFKEDDIARENLLTLNEIAHFVRCIPHYKMSENFEIWSSPDYFLTIRRGSVVDHALLMASMFQGTICEEQKDMEDLKVIMAEKDKRKRNKALHIFRERQRETPIKDRVFVCLGKLNNENGNKQHAWVMTINRKYDTITFWEALKPIKYELKHRITYAECQWLRNYLSPQLSSSDRKKINKIIVKANKKKEEEEKKKEEKEKEEQEKKEKAARKKKARINMKDITSKFISKKKEQQSQESEKLESSDSDDDVSEPEASLGDIHVAYNDLRQDLRPNFISNIGNPDYQERKRKELLSASYGKNNKQKEEKKQVKNKFLADQEERIKQEEKKKKEKHLFPIKEFKDEKDRKVVDSTTLPYAQLEDPKDIKTDHRSGSDDDSSSKKSDDEINNKSNEGARTNRTKADDADHDDEYHILKEKSAKDQIDVFKRKGIYLREFAPFYNLKSMEKLYSEMFISKKVHEVIITVEMGLKSIRSAQNKNTSFIKGIKRIKKYEEFLDILEGEAAGRYEKEKDVKEAKREALIAIRKQIPPEYQIDMQPSRFDHFDSDRINTMLLEHCEEFMTTTPRKARFVIACRIYNYY